MTDALAAPTDSIDRFLRRLAATPLAEQPDMMIVADDAHAALVRERMKALGLEDQLGAVPMITHAENEAAKRRGSGAEEDPPQRAGQV